LTLRRGTGVVDAAAEAKREFLQVRATWRPQLISETHSADGGLPWDVILYADDGGQRDGIWIADLDGWTLEYRVTYRGDLEAQVMADVSAMTAAVQTTAGAQLGVCAKSPEPARTGRRITDDKDIGARAMMTALLGATTTMMEQKPGQLAAKPIAWCAEQALKAGPAPALFWRGVDDDGSDAKTDRVTLMTVGPPPTMTVDNDPLAAIVDRETGKKPRWVARVAHPDETSVYGYFTDRPPAAALTALFADVLTGKAKPLTSYGAKGGQISIRLPPSK
jgi:hypothetical protein